MNICATGLASVGLLLVLAGCTSPQRHLPLDARLMPAVLSGRVSVIDGRTFLFPEHGRGVRLMNIDTCDLAQWVVTPATSQSGPSPVPCGAKAKAWLTRTVGTQSVDCIGVGHTRQGEVLAYCTVKNRDVALEMLAVGLAMIDTPNPLRPEYFVVQAEAIAKEYGIWGTFVLDMDEWRRRAVDQTPTRKPIADYNLLADRNYDMTPPMIRSRQLPKTTSR